MSLQDRKKIMSTAECIAQAHKCRSWAEGAVAEEARNAFTYAADAWERLAKRYQRSDQYKEETIYRAAGNGPR